MQLIQQIAAKVLETNFGTNFWCATDIDGTDGMVQYGFSSIVAIDFYKQSSNFWCTVLAKLSKDTYEIEEWQVSSASRVTMVEVLSDVSDSGFLRTS